MAFATTVLHTGVMGDKRYVGGKWTGTVGDASGTLAVHGALVSSAHFMKNTTTNPTEPTPVTYSTNTTTGITTFTIHNHETVTDGCFTIVLK